MGQALDILRNSLANHGGTNIHISIYWIYKYIEKAMCFIMFPASRKTYAKPIVIPYVFT